MLRLTHIIGSATDAELASRLHGLAHDDLVETVTLDASDIARKRLRVTTDRGTDCAIDLERSAALFNGAVLLLEPRRAVLVRLSEPGWLGLTPVDAAAALELGYSAGNLHWKVRFAGSTLQVALDGPPDDYLARLAPLIDAGRVRLVEP